MSMDSIQIDNFDGGITDNYIDGLPNRYRYADNFNVNFRKKLYTRPGSLIYNSTYYQIPAGAQRIGALIPYGDTYLFQQSAKRFYWIDAGWNTLTGPSGNHVLSTGDTTNYVSTTEWNGHIFVTSDAYPSLMKFYLNDSSVFELRNMGLPAVTAPTVTKGGAGANSYIYAFIYYYDYNVLTVDYADEGEPTYVQITAALAPDASTVAITNIPVIANGATDNYDTTNIKVKIYRTTNGGTTYYYVGQVTNGTTTYNDTASDATITGNNVTLYVTNGTLAYEAPPKCKFLHIVNNHLYYASIKEGTQELKNTIQQSFDSNPDATNALFRVTVDEEIKGISSYQYTPIVGTTKNIYRLDGNYFSNGTGSISRQKILERVGLLSNNSFVQTPKGLFFAGTDGFYWTNGFQCLRLSSEFNKRYKTDVAQYPDTISGTYDADNDQVLWAVNEEDADNSAIYVLHLIFGIKEDACFTKWNGGSNFVPTCLLYFNNTFLRGDSRGYVIKHDVTTYSDIKIDTLVVPSSWQEKAIIFNFESCAFNLGTNYMRKYVTRILVTCSNETRLSVNITSVNDIGKISQELKPIRHVSSLIWGDPDVVWGDPDIVWGEDGIIENLRRFVARGLRCTYKQIIFTNDFTTIETSATTCQAVTNASTKQITLVDGALTWPSLCVDQYISFSGDDYAKEFLIVTATSSTLTLSDTGNQLPGGTYDWKIRGYAKREIFNLLNYVLEYTFIGKTQTPYRPST